MEGNKDLTQIREETDIAHWKSLLYKGKSANPYLVV